jgi:choline dehydrogenase-like flavoprotein
MIGNLQEQGTLEDQADFMVIGAGTVGLPTSVLLARKTGERVVCLESGDYHQDGWPISLAALESYLPDVESLFGLQPRPYCDLIFPFELGEIHVNRLAKWPTFKKRSVVDLVGNESRDLPNLKIWINATVTEILAVPDGKGVEVLARSLSGDCVRLSAPRLIIAAGAIETTPLRCSSISKMMASDLSPKLLPVMERVLG